MHFNKVFASSGFLPNFFAIFYAVLSSCFGSFNMDSIVFVFVIGLAMGALGYCTGYFVWESNFDSTSGVRYSVNLCMSSGFMFTPWALNIS